MFVPEGFAYEPPQGALVARVFNEDTVALMVVRRNGTNYAVAKASYEAKGVTKGTWHYLSDQSLSVVTEAPIV